LEAVCPPFEEENGPTPVQGVAGHFLRRRDSRMPLRIVVRSWRFTRNQSVQE